VAEVVAPVIDVNPNAAPIEAPAEIAPETGFDLTNVRSVEGVVGGIVGGIVGGVLSAPPPPPPPVEPVRVGGNIVAPEKTKNVDPRYPPVAQSARVSGVVILEAVIGLDGRVTDVKILRSVPLLDDAAIAAVRQWEYTPTLLNGVAVPVIMTVTVNFQLR
jgi:protein TonB